MSKYVKNLIAEEYRRRLAGVNDAVLVNVVGLDATTSNRLRAELREKGIHLMVVKNGLAARATAGTPLAALFEDLTGPGAICWGGEDIVALAKEVIRLAQDRQYPAFEARAGIIDGGKLTAKQVEEVSKWPSREEQLSILVGQILGPGSQLSAQMLGPGQMLASQVKQKSEEEESDQQEDSPE